MARIIVCDVNETLLDVQALEPHFARAFGDGRILREWFSTVLLYSEVATLAGPYTEFSAIGGAALDMTAAGHGVALSTEDRQRILQGMLSLPPHPDVRDGSLRAIVLRRRSSPLQAGRGSLPFRRGRAQRTDCQPEARRRTRVGRRRSLAGWVRRRLCCATGEGVVPAGSQ